MSDPHPSRYLEREGDENAPPTFQIVGGAFVVAVFAWGLSFYGLGFFLVNLQAIHGWSLATLSTLTLVFYLAATLFGFGVGAALQRTNGQPVFLTGAVCLGAAMLGMSEARSLWQVVIAYLLMALGWASLSLNPISATIVAWYGDRSSTPLTIALTGASAGGIIVLPLLVWSGHRFGFQPTLRAAAGVEVAVVGAIALLLLRMPDRPPVDRAQTTAAWRVLSERRFWTLALGLATAIAAQVGFLVHQLNLLTEFLSETTAAGIVVLTTASALLGRLAFILLSRRLGPERAGLGFIVLQSTALIGLGSIGRGRITLAVGCALVGFAVGVLITLPALFTRSTFVDLDFPTTFPLVNAVYQVGVAIGAPVLATFHGWLGGYGPALVAMGVVQLGALLLLALSERARFTRQSVSGT